MEPRPPSELKPDPVAGVDHTADQESDVDVARRLADRLNELIDRTRRRRAGADPEAVLETARVARRAAAMLAVQRRRLGPADPAIEALERAIVRSRTVIAVRPSRRQTFLSFFSVDYWRLIVERAGPLGIATALLLVPALFGYLWALRAPETVAGFLPPGFLWVQEAESTDMGAGALGLAGFSLFVMRNNIQVTLITFVLGVTWGVGTAWVVAQNGLILGAVAGLAMAAGNGRVLVEAIIAHGVLELSCIVIGGAAGLAVGRAMLRPGDRSRMEALRTEAVEAVRMAVGTAPWLVLAGVIEGYGSRTGLDAVPATIIGLAVGAVFWGLVWRLGRSRPAGSKTPG